VFGCALRHHVGAGVSLLAADDADSEPVGAPLEGVEEYWDADGLKVDADKAWDAIHAA
jgi:hypothetical protein